MIAPDAMWAWVPEALRYLGGFVFTVGAPSLCIALGIKFVRAGAS